MDKLKEIFAEQRELMDRYHPIEEANGLLISGDVPVDLDSRFGQARLKDMAWRMTEELGEALDAYPRNWSAESSPYDRFREELSDVLHFLSEFTILSGFSPDNLVENAKGSHGGDTLDVLFQEAEGFTRQGPDREMILQATAEVVAALAMACNCLKNKAWKQTHTPTDRLFYLIRIQDLWSKFIQLCVASGIRTADELHGLYFRKAQINRKRQDSGY